MSAWSVVGAGLAALVAATAAPSSSSPPSQYCPTSPQCKPGVMEECGQLFGLDTNQFHGRDTSCSNGDPNGMFYDEQHDM